MTLDSPRSRPSDVRLPKMMSPRPGCAAQVRLGFGITNIRVRVRLSYHEEIHNGKRNYIVVHFHSQCYIFIHKVQTIEKEIKSI